MVQEYAKSIYVIELFDTPAEMLNEKINEGKKCHKIADEFMNDYLVVKTHAHPASTATQASSLKT